MTNAAWSLQQSIYETLRNDLDLTTLLGGQDIFDDVPRAARFPYLTLGQSTIRDWSGTGLDGAEHLLTLHVWSRANGRKEVYEILDVLRGLLNDASLGLVGYRLICLSHQFSEARREPDGETYHGLIRFRAVTEPE